MMHPVYVSQYLMSAVAATLAMLVVALVFAYAIFRDEGIALVIHYTDAGTRAIGRGLLRGVCFVIEKTIEAMRLVLNREIRDD